MAAGAWGRMGNVPGVKRGVDGRWSAGNTVRRLDGVVTSEVGEGQLHGCAHVRLD